MSSVDAARVLPLFPSVWCIAEMDRLWKADNLISAERGDERPSDTLRPHAPVVHIPTAVQKQHIIWLGQPSQRRKKPPGLILVQLNNRQVREVFGHPSTNCYGLCMIAYVLESWRWG